MKSQESDWAFLKKYLLGPNAPETACWGSLDGIVTALNLIASVPAYNHLLLPDGGGTDLVSAELAPEEGCIYLHDNLKTTMLVKPYVQSLEGWYDYLTRGHSVHKDYIDGVLSHDELIQKIYEMTDFEG